jgi:curved DNA-binding protein CbpA
MTTSARDYYKVLQVDSEAEPEIIQAAYETLAARFHPENDLTGVHEIRMRELNRAYEVLSNAGRRRAYDIERSAPYEPMGPGELIGVASPEPEPEAIGASSASPRGLSARLAAGPRGSGDPRASMGTTVLDFGRYAGSTLLDIARQDAEYLRWLSRHSSGIRFRNEIERVLRSVGQAL